MTLIDKAEALLPCPFCGGKPYLANVAMVGCAYVVCTDCRMQSDDGSQELVVAAWNRRALPAVVPGVKPLDVLAGLSSYLGAGLGDDDTTPEQYDERIRWGIDHQIAVTVQRCADVIEELSKEAYSGKRVHWGQIKQAILAVSPAIAALPAAVPGMKPLEIAGDDKYLILKRGMYYRPNAQGYTSNPGEAGRYTLAQAVFHTHPNGPDGPRDGMSFVPLAAALIGEPRT